MSDNSNTDDGYLGLGDPGYRGDFKGIASAIQFLCSCRLPFPE